MFRRKPKSDVYSRRAAGKAIRSKGGPTQKYSKSYTTKEWKKFSPDAQQILTNRYHVTLSDYKPKKSKIKSITNNLKKVRVTSSLQKVDRGISMFDKEMNTFNKGFKVIDDTFTPQSKKYKYDFSIMTKFDRTPAYKKKGVNSFLPKYL